VKKERASSREIIAVKLLLKDIIRYMDAIYLLQAGNCEAEFTIEKFRETCQHLGGLQEETKAMYFDLLIDMMGRVAIPNVEGFLGSKYQGTSRRVKNAMQKRLATDPEELAKQKPVKRKPKIREDFNPDTNA
jgi:hypothetical protein